MPLFGRSTGIVLALKAVVSGSKSAAVIIVLEIGVPSLVDETSFTITGGSFIGRTVMKTVSEVQSDGNINVLSHTFTTK